MTKRDIAKVFVKHMQENQASLDCDKLVVDMKKLQAWFLENPHVSSLDAAMGYNNFCLDVVSFQDEI